MDGSRWIRITLGALGLTLLVSVALLIRTAQGKRTAETSWNDLYALAMHAHAGMYVPVYETLTLDGDSVGLGDVHPGRRQVLYFFTTSCPYCKASIETWKSVARDVAGRPDVEVYGVGVDSANLVAAYAREHGLSYPVTTTMDARWTRLFRVSGVPLTMVVDPGGQVSYARRGQFSSEVLADSLKAALDVPLVEEPKVPVTVPSVGSEAPSG